MTKAQYAAYVSRVDDFYTREGLDCLCQEGNEEPYFTWRHCDCCGETYGGNRVTCNGYNPTTKEIQGPYCVCEDCVYFAEYGRLDDATMMEIDG